MRFSALLLPLLFVAHAPAIQAQTLSPQVSVSLGVIEDIDYTNSYALYPQLRLSTTFLQNAATRFGGNIYVGTWADRTGPEELRTCEDCIIYSHSSLIVGTRIEMRPMRLFIPLSMHVGMARHFIWFDYVGGASAAGREGSDHRESYNTVDLGVQLEVPIRGPFYATGGTQWYLSLDDSFRDSRGLRSAYSLGITYVL